MKKIISVFVLLLFSGLVMLVAESPKEVTVLPEKNRQKACENVICSAVCIQGKDYYGSGSVFEINGREIIIVTNRHVAEAFDDNSYVTFFSGAKCKADVLGLSEEADVGFLCVKTSDLPKEERKQLRTVGKQEKIYEELKKNDCFFMVDVVNNQKEPLVYQGAVVDKERFLTDYGTEMLYGDGNAVPGMSGSGIFDDYGNYIAMLSGMTDRCEIAGVPLPVILAEYEKTRKFASQIILGRTCGSSAL